MVLVGVGVWAPDVVGTYAVVFARIGTAKVDVVALNVAQLAFPLVAANAIKARPSGGEKVVAVDDVATFAVVFARIGTAMVDIFAAGGACLADRAKALKACWRIVAATARSTVHARIGRARFQTSGAGRASPARSTSACI
jgi:hypothetical protein